MPTFKINRQIIEFINYPQERARDPLLTALTVMLAVLMFVLAPLQAAGVLAAHWFGFRAKTHKSKNLPVSACFLCAD
jgi:hypothetical protein